MSTTEWWWSSQLVRESALALYVTLSRATQRLTTVATEPWRSRPRRYQSA